MIKMKVPKWKTPYPFLNDANKEQKRFYKAFVSMLDKDEKIELKGNLSYIFVYLYKTLTKFIIKKDINDLIIKFDRIESFYGNEDTVSSYINMWRGDAYRYIGDNDTAWQYKLKENYIRVEEILSFRGKCTDKSIKGEDVCRMLGSSYSKITKYGKENIELVSKLVTIFFDEFSVINGKNYIEYFTSKFDHGNLTQDDFRELEGFFAKSNDFISYKDDYEMTQKSKKPYPKTYDHCLFTGADVFSLRATPEIEVVEIPRIISNAYLERIKMLIRESEHTLRAEHSIPNIVEHWENESDLYIKILQLFPGEKIVHHGKPDWIKRYHLDIYFPLRNIAIEYMGKRLSDSGESYEKQLIDIKKDRWCKENICRLIHVYDNYNLEEVQILINSIIDNKKQLSSTQSNLIPQDI
jgi:hypothetical protein